jgi:hypothetical protein
MQLRILLAELPRALRAISTGSSSNTEQSSFWRTVKQSENLAQPAVICELVSVSTNACKNIHEQRELQQSWLFQLHLTTFMLLLLLIFSPYSPSPSVLSVSLYFLDCRDLVITSQYNSDLTAHSAIPWHIPTETGWTVATGWVTSAPITADTCTFLRHGYVAVQSLAAHTCSTSGESPVEVLTRNWQHWQPEVWACTWAWQQR